MARPETIADLANYQTEGRQVATFTDVVMGSRNTQIMKALYDFLDAAEALGWDVTTPTYGAGFDVKRPKTPEELEDALSGAQSAWDTSEGLYHEAAADPAGFKQEKAWGTWNVDRHAEDNGYDPIEWPDES